MVEQGGRPALGQKVLLKRQPTNHTTAAHYGWRGQSRATWMTGILLATILGSRRGISCRVGKALMKLYQSHGAFSTAIVSTKAANDLATNLSLPVEMRHQKIHIWCSPAKTKWMEHLRVQGTLPLIQRLTAEIIYLPVLDAWNMYGSQSWNKLFRPS